MIDKKTSKEIDKAVLSISVAIYQAARKITDEVQREIERRLVQTIQDRWEYQDKLKEK